MSDRFFGFDLQQKKVLQAQEADILDLQTQVANLNAWATAFATKLNADATAQNALNAFPLTLDTNYDTNPQA